MSKGKGIRVWISRDTHSDDVQMFVRKPRKETDYAPWLAPSDDDDWYFDGDPIQEFCVKEFQRVTGHKLAKGELKHVRIRIEEV